MNFFFFFFFFFFFSTQHFEIAFIWVNEKCVYCSQGL